jgi:hypothetical protein
MNIKKISLFSLIFTTSFALNSATVTDAIDPTKDNSLESIQKNIKAELSIIDKKLFNREKYLEREKERLQDKKELHACWLQAETEMQSLRGIFSEPYAQCSTIKNDYNAKWPAATHGDIYYSEKQTEYKKAESAYGDFLKRFKRCKRHNNSDCLNNLAKEIREWNKNN